jgi:hypothetical protein
MKTKTRQNPSQIRENNIENDLKEWWYEDTGCIYLYENVLNLWALLQTIK